MSLDRRSGAFPVPRIYECPFQSQPAWVFHWHWFWLAKNTVYILRPPPPGVMVTITPGVIDALALALVADVLAEAEPVHENGAQP